MTKTFHLTVARVGENLFEGAALSLTLPGTEGVFTVLAGHEAYVSALSKGEAVVRADDGAVHRFELTEGGICEVSGGQATVLL